MLFLAYSAFAQPNAPVDHPPVNQQILKGLGLYPFVYPVMTPRISSSYGNRKHPLLKFSRKHQGIDLAADLDAPIRSVAKGVVVFADPYAGYGNFVVVQHTKGITTHYGHCKNLEVKPGQHIEAGRIIAKVGNTGISTGPHLHFEIRINGISQNPEDIIPDLADHPEG